MSGNLASYFLARRSCEFTSEWISTVTLVVLFCSLTVRLRVSSAVHAVADALSKQVRNLLKCGGMSSQMNKTG